MYHVTIISIVLPGWVLYDHITDHITRITSLMSWIRYEFDAYNLRVN